MKSNSKIITNIKSTTLPQIRAKIAAFFTLAGLAIFRPGSVSACEGVEISIGIGDSGNCIEGEGTDLIFGYLAAIIQFLAAGVGVVVTLMIVIGGVQYIAASGSTKGAEKGGNPEAIKAAKKKILHAVEALILFIFMAAIANFLIPGGIV